MGRFTVSAVYIMPRRKRNGGTASPRNSPRLKPSNNRVKKSPMISASKSPRFRGQSPRFKGQSPRLNGKSPRFSSISPQNSPSLNSFDLFNLDDVEELEHGDEENERVPVGYCFDERMATCHPCPSHHPERPERVLAVHEYLEETDVLSQMKQVQIVRTKKEEIEYCHATSVARKIFDYDHCAPHRGLDFIDGDTFFSKKTATAATLSCGAVVSLTREVLDGNIRSGIAICRPPGHHAECSKQMGFCHINNVCVAAEVAIREYGLKRVLIFDWDVHHGNGTQDIFWEREDVMYMSIHRHDKGKFYPGTPAGESWQVGENEGKGYNVNLPLDGEGYGDYHYVESFQKLFLPIANEYQPELILVSAGFDCARGDPLGGQDVTERGFSFMTSKFMHLCPNVVVALEGGYNIQVIPKMYHAVATTLLEEKKIKPRDVRESCVKDIVKRKEEDEFRIRTKKFYSNLEKALENQCEHWHIEPDLHLTELETRLKRLGIRLGANVTEDEEASSNSCVLQ